MVTSAGESGWLRRADKEKREEGRVKGGLKEREREREREEGKQTKTEER